MRFSSPSKTRMVEFFSRMPLPPWHPKADVIGQAYISRMAEMDVAFQLKVKSLNQKLPHFVMSRMQSGSGFRMAGLLRQFFLEYLSRLLQHGPYSLPTSFNVVEGFLTFNNDFLVFDLLPERDHLLRLHDYFDWYTTERMLANDPKILIDIIEEKVIYSYDMTGDSGEFAISAEGSRIAIAGLSMVRHENELSVLLLAGENPPNPPDTDVLAAISGNTGSRPPGKEDINPDEDLTIKDRYLDGMNGFSKVILLTRYNLVTKKHDVKYLNLDIGPTYSVFTDDIAMLEASLGKKKTNDLVDNQFKQLSRYHELFSTLTALIYLPVMFVDEQRKVVDSTFVTEIGVNSQKLQVQKAVKELGKKHFNMHRTVRCMTSINNDNLKMASHRIIEPPKFTFETSGYWKPIGVNEVGEDKNGNPVVGKTWVERIEKYTVKSPDSFVIQNQPRVQNGRDPGTIYIMRSPAHGNDVYKIGLTRRTSGERALELSSTTGVPLPFEVLASWEVRDCSSVEKGVHSQLRPFRLNKRREFFGANLSSIVAAVEQAIIRTDAIAED
jgi:hypothetical protein